MIMEWDWIIQNRDWSIQNLGFDQEKMVISWCGRESRRRKVADQFVGPPEKQEQRETVIGALPFRKMI